MNRDQMKAEFRELVMRKHWRAIGEGYEPGIERMLDSMADVADKHAGQQAELAAKEAAAIALAATPPNLDFTPNAAPEDALARTPAPVKPAPRRTTRRTAK